MVKADWSSAIKQKPVCYLLCAFPLILLVEHWAMFWPVMLMVLFIGLPHGLLDPWIAFKNVSLQKTSTWLFLFGYLVLSIVVYLGWVISPLLSFILFLLVSAYHFGADWGEQRTRSRIQCVALGGLIIALPVIFHPAETMRLFLLLTGYDFSGVMWLFVVWCVVGTTFLLYRPNKANVVEGLLLVITSAVASPFIYFSCYFCLLHSYRHYAEYLPSIVTRQDFSIRFLSLLLIMTYLLLIGLFLSLESIHPVEDKSLQTLFWGLASLTVPHMFVIALSKSKKCW